MSDQWDQVSIIIHTKLTGGDSRVVLSGWKCLQLQKLKLAWNTFRFAQSADVDLRVGRFSIKIISKPESQTSHSPQLPASHLLLSFQKVRESIFPIFCPRWGCGEVVIHMLLRQSSWVMTILALIGNYLRISLALITAPAQPLANYLPSLTCPLVSPTVLCCHLFKFWHRFLSVKSQISP